MIQHGLIGCKVAQWCYLINRRF